MTTGVSASQYNARSAVVSMNVGEENYIEGWILYEEN
jgi:hypothetical protein